MNTEDTEDTGNTYNSESCHKHSDSVSKCTEIDTVMKSQFNKFTYGIWTIKKPTKLPGTQCTLTGYSICARKTNFYIPELQVMLDAGLPSKSVPEHIFITHCHSDHCYNLPMTLVDIGQKRPKIYVPKSKVTDIKNFIHSAYVMTTCSQTPRIHNKYEIIGVVPNTSIDVTIRNKKWKVEIIQCYHTVPCVGFGFMEMRKKLKEEFKNLKGREIGKLRKQGINVSNEIHVPMFCYIGDTNYKVLENPELYKYKTIIVECTFISDEHLEAAKKKRHMHWNQLKPYVEKYKNITFVLYHFSARYREQEIKEFFKSKNYDNIIPWI